MTIAIARRKFIALLGVAGSWPLAARAQQTGSPVIGFLSSVDPVSMEKPVSAFHQGLDHMGFIDGRNVTVTYEWAKNQYDRLPALTQALVRQGVSVIVTSGGEPAAFAAKAATKTIPIVFNTNGDPVRLGLATDLRRPGGNLTGISGLETTAVVAKGSICCVSCCPSVSCSACWPMPRTSIRKQTSAKLGRTHNRRGNSSSWKR